jgi:hypothetical protein
VTTCTSHNASSTLLALASAALLAGCQTHAVALTTAHAERPGPAEPAADEPVNALAPASSRLTSVEKDMTHEQVEEIMGSPTGRISFPTAGTYNPYASDSGNRVVYKYEGEGRILFSVPKHGGSMRVLRIDQDPTEDGQ